VRTKAFAIAATVAVALVGLGLIWKMSSPAEEAATGSVHPLSSGAGLTLQFSDHPVAAPAMAVADLDGQPLSLQQIHGKVILVNFWATWCGPCREEIPTLVALQDHYRDQLLIVGLSIDERPASEVKDFARQFAVNYPIAIADESVQKAFGGISSVPATFVLNPSGQIVQRHVGTLDPRRTEHEVRALAGLPTPATVQQVKDTGQVLLANAAYATSIPGVDFTGFTPDQKAAALQRMNTEKCTCGCGLTVAQCRINDPTCDVSLPLAQTIAEEAGGRAGSSRPGP
jgi:thiol-disulfide isomerase/thioredoxin